MCSAWTGTATLLLAASIGAGCGDDDDLRPADGGARDSAVADARDMADARDTATGEAGSGDGAVGPPRWEPDERFPWPMAHHDVRRTGRSPFVGPHTLTPGAARNWTFDVPGGSSINVQAAVTESSVLFGTWGSPRHAVGAPVDDWYKSDGRFYGLSLDAPVELFPAFEPEPVHACYRYPAEAQSSFDLSFCDGQPEYHASFYNGTIETPALVDPDSGALYVGRGDGNLYAIDPEAGRVLWTFRTFDPRRPDHPDGGGEIIGGALMGPDRRIYFGTYGVPWPGSAEQPVRETHAIYAIEPDGTLAWRYPQEQSSLDNPVLAAPALSPDGHTLYVATFFGDGSVPGNLLALDLDMPTDAGDEARLRWKLPLINPDRPAHPAGWVRHLSVGVDGTVFVTGGELRFGGTAAFVTAIRDDASGASYEWSPAWVEPHGYPDAAGHMGAGIALWESGGAVERVYLSSTHVKDVNGERAGLFVLDAASGAVIAVFDPGALPSPLIGGLTAPTLDADEVVYVGARGRHDLLIGPDVATSQWLDGALLALRFDEPSMQLELLAIFPVDGQLDWVSPAVGANGAIYFGSSAPFSPLDTTWFSPDETPPRRTPRFYALFE